jgi:hypothetical protein
MKRMQQIPNQDRPREKLQARGVASLSDFELLQALIGSGNKQADVSKIAKNTLELFKKQSYQDISFKSPQCIVFFLSKCTSTANQAKPTPSSALDYMLRGAEQGRTPCPMQNSRYW